MPYNGGMTDLALVLPFALPPSELAPDLVEHLKTPALATLLGKASSATRRKDDDSLRHLPHERLLAQALGASGTPAWAGAAMRGFGLDPAAGAWFMVHPAHIEIARSHLLLNDLRHLGLNEPQSRALFDSALPYATELGLDLVYGDATTWFLRADRWAEMQTASPDAAAGLDVSFFLPDGQGSVEFRKLQNELQMLWYEHPANAEREARGQRPINAIWPWAGGSATLAPVHCAEGPSWLAALSTGSGGTPSVTPAQAGAHGKDQATRGLGNDTVVVIDTLSAAAIAGDWAVWLSEMERLEQLWFAPLLEQLRTGQTSRIHLHLTSRDSGLAATVTGRGLRAFWRRPSLDRLIK